MPVYGMKIKDASGNACVITPEIGTIISAGRLTMPSGLVDTDKYYATINLPATIPVADLTVLVTSVKWTMRVIRQTGGVAPLVYNIQTSFLNSSYPYYSKVDSTGVMTAYTAGNRTLSNPSTWNHVVTAYPLVYWELLGASNVSSIKIFAATCYCTNIITDTTWWPATDPSYPVNQFRYSIYTNGVETVDYMIICKKYNY